jgi:hypothetical protein
MAACSRDGIWQMIVMGNEAPEKGPEWGGFIFCTLTGRYWPIVMKKSAMVSTAEKYALDIDIFTLSRAFRAQISRSCAQKRYFSTVSTRAAWKDRLFQHNWPIPACHNGLLAAQSV